jgi:DNA-binding protein H-NS
MSTLQQLLDQQAAIARQIDALKTQSKDQAIAEVKALMETHGLTVADVRGLSRKTGSPPSGKKVAAKYRNAVSGQTWTGRGLKPKWLSDALAEGKTLADFVI